MAGCVLTQVDWQAWATLATGLMAVGAALWVGKRQTEILEGQNKLKEDENRIELLKYRSDTITKLKYFMGAHAFGKSEIPYEDWSQAYDNLIAAELIFPRDLTEIFRECLQQIRYHRKHFKHADDAWNRHEKQESSETEIKTLDKQLETMNVLENLLNQMIDHARVDLA